MTTSTTTNEKNRKKQTLAQTIDQVMTIKMSTESSKSELSSGGKRPFKVLRVWRKKSENDPGSADLGLADLGFYLDSRGGGRGV